MIEIRQHTLKMEAEIKMIYDYLIEYYPDHVFNWLYVLNLIFGIIAYRLGFARKLPLLKSFLVYIMLAIGTFILTIFNVLGTWTQGPVAPVTEVLILTSLVLAIYRFRMYRTRQARQARQAKE